MNESSSYSSYASYEDSELKKDLIVSNALGDGDISFQAAKALYSMNSKSEENFE